MADSFLKNGGVWGPSSVFVGPTNDGADTTILPLEDVTGPPYQNYGLANIVGQWQPNLVVISVAPRGNQPQAAAPLPHQDYRELENGIQWQQTWGAQRQAPVAAWNFADPIPRQDYRERENGLQWQQDWRAQAAAPNAGWNITPDNPPPLKAYPQQVNAAWQPSLLVINVSPKNGASVETVDAPPPRALPRVDVFWQVSWWPAQSAPDNAAWNFVVATPDNPPPLRAYLPQVNAAWQPNLVVISVPPKGGGSVDQADAPPPRQDYAERVIAAQWQLDWRAQRAAPNAAWNFTAGQVDNPPPRRPYLAHLVAAHFGYAVSVVVRNPTDGASSVDDPPRIGHAWLTIVVGQWQQEWRAQRAGPNASWNFVAPDNPPPRQEYRERENGLPWAQSWSAQKAAPIAGLITPGAPPPDNPPPRQQYGLREVVVQWQQVWGAQRPAPNAGWNFTLPDNPPVRQLFGLREVVAQWQVSWGAQHAAPNAGWNFTPPDNPPGRRPEVSQGVHGAWIVSWKTQRAGPPTQEAPAVVPVYGWGARSKIGSATGRDPWTRIGSSSASASDGKIGSEDA